MYTLVDKFSLIWRTTDLHMLFLWRALNIKNDMKVGIRQQ